MAKAPTVDGRTYWLAVRAARVSARIFAERMADNLRREAADAQ